MDTDESLTFTGFDNSLMTGLSCDKQPSQLISRC